MYSKKFAGHSALKSGLFSEKKIVQSKDEEDILNTKFAENLYLRDFKKLIEIDCKNKKKRIYISFDQNFIKDFDHIHPEELSAFKQTAIKGRFCPTDSKIKVGVKRLLGEITCILQKGERLYKTKFTHELKIDSDNRIAMFTLTPIDGGPILLVASHYIKKGLHTKEKSTKTYYTLDLATKPKMVQPSICKATLFAVKHTKPKPVVQQPTTLLSLGVK